MELNTKGRYAVMALADLAKYGRDTDEKTGEVKKVAVPLSAVAARQQLSLAYLEQIFLQLRRAGLVESARGRSGGYRLARPEKEINIAEVMAAVEEQTRMTRCDHQAGPCLGDEKCMTHGLWHALGVHIDTFLSRVNLSDIVEGEFAPKSRMKERLDQLVVDAQRDGAEGNATNQDTEVTEVS